jgi:hypothetical protein
MLDRLHPPGPPRRRDGRERPRDGTCDKLRVAGIHLRYLVDDLRVIKGVGVFQKGSVALVPRDLAVPLIISGDFEA